MPEYEIVNPSDCYTIRHDDRLMCCVAVLLLGQGMYGLRDEDQNSIMPPMIFGGADAWLRENQIEDLDKWIEAHSGALAEALDSVMIGDFSDRAAYERGLRLIDDENKRKVWRDGWLDDRRSSLNNIGGRAFQMAKRLRENSRGTPCDNTSPTS